MIWLSVISLVVAGVSALFAGFTWFVAKKSLSYNALAEIMRDYAEDRFHEDATTLWNFYREECGENGDTLRRQFKQFLDQHKRAEINIARRRVSHFYHRVAALHVGGVLSGKALYTHWTNRDLRIIPKIIIPLEEVLYKRLHGEMPSGQFERLQTLYDDSEKLWRQREINGRRKRRREHRSDKVVTEKEQGEYYKQHAAKNGSEAADEQLQDKFRDVKTD